MFIRIRLIPVTIAFVILMLIFRVGSMWNDGSIARAIQNDPPLENVTQTAPAFSLLGQTLHRDSGTQMAASGLFNDALAQNTGAAVSAESTVGSGADTGVNQTPTGTPTESDSSAATPRLVDLADVPLRSDPDTLDLIPLTVVEDGFSDNDLIDINALSVAEVRLLHTLATRRRILDSRERGLTERESVVVAAERRLQSQQLELEEIRTEIRKSLQIHDERQEQQIFQMREVYSTMAPKQAALIFNELDMDTLVNVISGMSARKIAPIIGLMQVNKARDVTLRLADRTTYSIDE